MHAGTCELPSASLATLPDLKADAAGRAVATGPVIFRGTENVALATMADGEHIIAIQSGGQVVACGVIPRLVPSRLPAAGGASFPLAPALVSALGLCAVSAGLFWQWRDARSGIMNEWRTNRRMAQHSLIRWQWAGAILRTALAKGLRAPRRPVAPRLVG